VNIAINTAAAILEMDFKAVDLMSAERLSVLDLRAGFSRRAAQAAPIPVAYGEPDAVEVFQKR
jgi:hypothetical protein